MFKMRNKFICILLIFCFFCSAHSLEHSDIFTTRQIVENDHFEPQEENIIPALNLVLTKYAARKVKLSNNILSPLQLKSVIDRYEYEIDTDNQQKWLKINFNKKELTDILHKMHINPLPTNRPIILLLLDVIHYDADNNASLTLRNVLQEKIIKLLRSYAIPAVYPLYDLGDETLLSTNDAEQLLYDSKNLLLKKYDADVLLLGNISIQISNWYANWSLSLGKHFWRRMHINIDDMAEDFVNNLVQKLKLEYGDNKENLIESRELITVEKLINIEKFSKIMNYIESFPTVSNVVPKEINNDTVTFEITLKGNFDVLYNNFNMDKVLILKNKENKIYKVGNGKIRA